MATIKSIKEKAKAYDKAIEKIQRYVKDDFGCTRLRPEDIFPELKESEDERIRKELVQFFEEKDEEDFEEWIPKAKVLAWLGKQGEHAKFRDSIQVGDKLTLNEDGVLVNLSQLNRVAKKDEKQGEQKLTKFEKAVKQVMEEAIECGDTHNLKADADMLLSLVHNSAWSEEDEKMIEAALQFAHEYGRHGLWCWLKSLKDRVQPQSTWKPSDEQIKVLVEVLIFAANNESPHWNDYIYGILKNLTRQLKKLREG